MGAGGEGKYKHRREAHWCVRLGRRGGSMREDAKQRFVHFLQSLTDKNEKIRGS